MRLETVKEVVDDLCCDINKDNIKEIRSLFDDDYNDPDQNDNGIQQTAKFIVRSGFGRHIRNKYKLWSDNKKLAEDCIKIDRKTATATYKMWKNKGIDKKEFNSLILGTVHPDDASAVIKRQFLFKLRELYKKYVT